MCHFVNCDLFKQPFKTHSLNTRNIGQQLNYTSVSLCTPILINLLSGLLMQTHFKKKKVGCPRRCPYVCCLKLPVIVLNDDYSCSIKNFYNILKGGLTTLFQRAFKRYPQAFFFYRLYVCRCGDEWQVTMMGWVRWGAGVFWENENLNQWRACKRGWRVVTANEPFVYKAFHNHHDPGIKTTICTKLRIRLDTQEKYTRLFRNMAARDNHGGGDARPTGKCTISPTCPITHTPGFWHAFDYLAPDRLKILQGVATCCLYIRCIIGQATSFKNFCSFIWTRSRPICLLSLTDLHINWPFYEQSLAWL